MRLPKFERKGAFSLGHRDYEKRSTPGQFSRRTDGGAGTGANVVISIIKTAAEKEENEAKGKKGNKKWREIKKSTKGEEPDIRSLWNKRTNAQKTLKIPAW